MQDQRFAQRPRALDWAGQQPAASLQAVSPKTKYLRDWKHVKRARFNAAKRYERKQNASTIAFAFAGIIGFLVPIYALLFKETLTVHTKNVLDFTAFVTGSLSLTLGLLEQAKDYAAKARRFDLCGRNVNSVLRRLTIAPIAHDEELRPLIEDYEKALEECGENHDDIDRDIANAQEVVDIARDRGQRSFGQDIDPLRRASKRAERQLRHLKWIERLQIYWLYGTMWVTPPVIGLMLWLFASSS